MNKIEDLPSWIMCDDCPQPHFLMVNRSLDGTWTAGYVEFGSGLCIIPINGSDTLDEAATRLAYGIDRRNKRSQDGKAV